HFLLVSGVRAGRGISGGGCGHHRRSRISENPRPQRNGLELLDGSGSASRAGACVCSAIENLAGRRFRCRPCEGPRRLSRFPHVVERRRPRHPYPEGSQGGVREIAMKVLRRLFLLEPDLRLPFFALAGLWNCKSYAANTI